MAVGSRRESGRKRRLPLLPLGEAVSGADRWGDRVSILTGGNPSSARIRGHLLPIAKGPRSLRLTTADCQLPRDPQRPFRLHPDELRQLVPNEGELALGIMPRIRLALCHSLVP